MSKADDIFIQNCKQILEQGFSTEQEKVRPHWEDGTPAYTIKTFGIVNRYNLQEEFPLLTLRATNWKAAIDEILWIWQKKSNNIKDLNSHIWDSWADENGSIGKAYGYQLGVPYTFKHGEMDQVDNVLWQLKNTPYSRRIMTNIYNFADLSEMGLEPCAYSMTFNVTGNKLNAHTKPTFPRHIGSQQLECGTIRRIVDDVCTSQRIATRRIGTRHQRYAYL